jgi:RNA polymerase sigma factor (sigma-70 family)
MLQTSQIDSLWNQYYPNVFAYFYRRVVNYLDVEDLAAITMNTFLSKLELGEIQLDQYYGYLWKIARTQLVEFFRSKSKFPISIDISNLNSQEPSSEEQVKSTQYELLIQQVFSQAEQILKPDELFLLQLSYRDGKNSVQISQQTGQNPATIRKRLSRIIAKLKTNLTPTY